MRGCQQSGPEVRAWSKGRHAREGKLGGRRPGRRAAEARPDEAGDGLQRSRDRARKPIEKDQSRPFARESEGGSTHKRVSDMQSNALNADA